MTRSTRTTICPATLLAASAVSQSADSRAERRSWAADNGNGTYSNPLFYDEFSDPDMIRVGSDYYPTGTTFQWVDLQRGDTLLMSLATHRYIVAPATKGPVAADHPGPAPDRKDGSCFQWNVVNGRRSK
jgi:hypothetical protein